MLPWGTPQFIVQGADRLPLTLNLCLWLLKVAEHSFLVPLRYSSLFSNHWQLGKIGKIQVQLKKLYLDMFHWTECRCHGNAAGNKPVLNNGFDLFSENPVVRFFPSFVSRKLRAILAC